MRLSKKAVEEMNAKLKELQAQGYKFVKEITTDELYKEIAHKINETQTKRRGKKEESF